MFKILLILGILSVIFKWKVLGIVICLILLLLVLIAELRGIEGK